eukprot:TRINITY_DN75817_c0_g1_i1.p1 TRINITY_DN75817_c0_g1~~TRINITY_DN75817_c0_g1_i1.p1  ORF type:complete len:656 (-),score=104.08 TRINITY_DN75817_c0_g1_i1:40-1908(-)
MSVFPASLTCLHLLFTLTSGAKIAARHSSAKTGSLLAKAASVANCPRNVFPGDGQAIIQALGFQEDVLDEATQRQMQLNLNATLGTSHPWTLGRPWTLSFDYESIEPASAGIRHFGFASGEGFLLFTVNPGVTGSVTVTDYVKSLPMSSRLEFRDAKVITVANAITLTNLCLQPAKCDWFFDQSETECVNDDLWSRKDNPSQVFGYTKSQCCNAAQCSAADPCKPTTMYSRKNGYDTALGSTPDDCCDPIPCDKGICNSTKWDNKPGQAFGTTQEECCVPRDCKDYTCSVATKYVAKKEEFDQSGVAILRQGMTDVECCDPVPCSAYNCTPDDKWTTNPQATLGSTLVECCNKLWCKDYTCSSPTRWTLDLRNPNKQGFSDESCCTKQFCSSWKCEHGYQLKAGAVKGDKPLLGSTHEECCEKRYCRDWVCSDPTKWIAKSDQDALDLDRAGWSDEECCNPLWCEDVECEPVTKWSRRSNDRLQGLQGNSSRQCCDPVYCASHVCTGDDPARGKKSTRWFKKQDTNHFKYMGSTDAECCVPRYCADYSTEWPTKYARLPDNKDRPRQGSTEAECYSELFCIDYCCVDEKKIRKAGAKLIMGSTDEECCEIDPYAPANPTEML